MRPVALILAILLSGCGASRSIPVAEPSTQSPAEIVAGCCDRAGFYPDWVIRTADNNSEVMRRLGSLQLRPGRLKRHHRAQEMILDNLRPLDVVFMNSKNRMSGVLIPGQFTHGAIYLGTQDQLRASGLWSLPALAPWKGEISDGAVFLEAVDGGVRLARPDIVLNTDALLALRPRGIDRKDALRRGIGQMGVPFDMRFDASDPSALFCAELIELMFPEINLPRTEVIGRETILVDAIAAGALSGELAFGMVGYVKATARGGVRVLSAQELAWDVRRAWPGVERVVEQ